MANRPWTLAGSLTELRRQLNNSHPGRSKDSDGTIGDEAHAQTVSDHNPDARGVVRAFDITHDPSHGVSGHELAAQLVASRDPRISYIIWDGRIVRAYAKPGIPAWRWSTYTGTDPHTNHVHLSVVADSRANKTTPWRIGVAATEEDSMANITIEEIERAAADGILSAKLGSSGPLVGVALQRMYGALVALTDSGAGDALADKIVAKLEGSEGIDAAIVKQAVKDALSEGIDE